MSAVHGATVIEKLNPDLRTLPDNDFKRLWDTSNPMANDNIHLPNNPNDDIRFRCIVLVCFRYIVLLYFDCIAFLYFRCIELLTSDVLTLLLPL
ncbi:hypothetical protein VNO77_44112 [Canavalia gladiata]|uniref:Uncharacterized protein n=1 Tax=Canavalia gladiata TaxID=3824 RepID=A0AAN9PQ25_CANGL